MVKKRVPRHSGSSGVTIVEMVIVLALLAVLTCAAAPSFAKLVSRERLVTAQIDLMTSLRYAREQASRSGRRTIICPSLDGQHCEATTRWELGRIVGYAEQDTKPYRIQAEPWHVHSGHRDLRLASSQGRRAVVFQATGYASGSNIGILICDPKRAELALQVFVSNPGRIRGARANAEAVEACRNQE